MAIILPYDKAHRLLLPHAEEPFQVIGRLLVTFDGSMWHSEEVLFSKATEKTYPAEEYDPAEYIENEDCAAFLALEDGKRVGSIRLRKGWNGYAVVEDIKVDSAFRGRGIGTVLLSAARKWCGEKGLRGLFAETQDNNLFACRFYQKQGFVLGGIDQRLYDASPYRGETALYFYRPL